jgi:hypothetical protein
MPKNITKKAVKGSTVPSSVRALVLDHDAMMKSMMAARKAGKQKEASPELSDQEDETENGEADERDRVDQADGESSGEGSSSTSVSSINKGAKRARSISTSPPLAPPSRISAGVYTRTHSTRIRNNQTTRRNYFLIARVIPIPHLVFGEYQYTKTDRNPISVYRTYHVWYVIHTFISSSSDAC